MNLISRLLIAAVLTGSALISPTLTIPSASAQACPDVQVIFARGTFEPPGVGGMGQAFVDSLRSKVGNKYSRRLPRELPGVVGFRHSSRWRHRRDQQSREHSCYVSQHEDGARRVLARGGRDRIHHR